MATVVRLGPLPLRQRRPSRITELERILGSSVHLIEVFTVAKLVPASLWRRERNTRGESFELFDGYGLLTPTGIVGLDDGSLSSE